MGLFKKFFSIGSRKSKKRSAVDPCTKSPPPVQEHLKPPQGDDTEEAVGRLLRSSSGRFATGSQIGLSSLPPLPHPIDSVIPLQSSSTTVASVSARSTYSVTIHSRTVHSRTEFPNAYPPLDTTFTPKRLLTDSARRRSRSVPITPRDTSRLVLLRQDPSVASLLNYYDDQGCLDSAIFSNTPSPHKEGHIQRHRTGSTLRQLLGHPSTPDLRNTSMEGDISWAEKFLGETDGTSSESSDGPLTPADTHFTPTHSIHDKVALPVECDNPAANQPTFSSLEVELSASVDFAHSQARVHENATPQRASQVFSFLGERKRVYNGPTSRLPQLKTTGSNYRRLSAESSLYENKQFRSCLPRPSSISIPHPSSPSLSSDLSGSLPPSPTAAAYLEESISHGLTFQQSSRVPRGPRPPSKIPSRQRTAPSSVACADDDSCSLHSSGWGSNTDGKSRNDTYARPCAMQSQIPKLRSASGSSSNSAESRRNSVAYSPRQHPLSLQPGVLMRPRSMEIELPASIVFLGKGNSDGASRLPQLITPIRPFGPHSQHLLDQPSPASSSELSPVAKQMMANLREQRTHARQRERQAGRLGSSQSRIRY